MTSQLADGRQVFEHLRRLAPDREAHVVDHQLEARMGTRNAIQTIQLTQNRW